MPNNNKNNWPTKYLANRHLQHTANAIGISLLLLADSEYAIADVKNSSSGFMDFNVYPYLSDVDTDSTATLNLAASLPYRLSYFSLSNFGNQVDSDELEDLETFYTEQNIRWKIAPQSALDLTLQMNFRSGIDNDRHRLGFRWRINDTPYFASFFGSKDSIVQLKYSLNFHLIQFDNEDADVRQIEHVFRMTLPTLTERFYLAGFIDHTFNQDLPDDFPKNPIVAEAQVGYRIVENFYVVAEYRVNQYRRADVNNFAAGIEYKIKW